MISKDEVKHIAKLARLELTEKEVEKMQKDLSEILGYFDLLKRVARPSATIPAAEGGLATWIGQMRADGAGERAYSI